jgi:hypothetical protein
MKKSDKPSRVVDKSNLLVKYVGIKDIPQNSEMFSKLSKSVTYEEEDVVVNSNIENLTPIGSHVGVYFLMRGSDCIAKCAIVNSEITDVLVDLKERGKGYCPYMIATVAKHRRDKYNQDAFIRVEKDNLAALSCYKKILLMKSTRLEWINSTEEDV